MEQFDPSDQKYKKVEDLPEEYQADFVNLGDGGFVRKEAWENYQFWKREAKEANKGRSVFKKVFLLDRKTFLDFAYEKAWRGSDVEVTASIEDQMTRAFKHMLPRLFPFIENHAFEAVISEENSGRFPAEVFRSFINKVYRARGAKTISLYPIEAGSELCGSDYGPGGKIEKQVLIPLERLLRNKDLGKGFLYVTEYVASGKTTEIVTNCFDMVIEKMEKEGDDENLPDIYCFATVAGIAGPYRDQSRSSSDGRRRYDFMHGGYNQNDYYYEHKRHRTNVSLMEKTSERFFELYNQYREQKLGEAINGEARAKERINDQ